MNPINSADLPSVRGGRYVPYFYKSGAFLSYASDSLPSVPSRSYRSGATYNFSTFPPSWGRLDHPQTVEQIISRGYLSVPNADAETAILGDKKHTAWLGLDDLIGQIRQRYEIYDRNMYELDLAVCEAANEVHRIEAARGQPANDVQQYAAHKRTQDVYEQKRTERVNLWRDVARARQVIPESAQQYLAAYRTVIILEGDPGDSP